MSVKQKFNIDFVIMVEFGWNFPLFWLITRIRIRSRNEIRIRILILRLYDK